jgi:hypothetical protein
VTRKNVTHLEQKIRTTGVTKQIFCLKHVDFSVHPVKFPEDKKSPPQKLEKLNENQENAKNLMQLISKFLFC